MLSQKYNEKQRDNLVKLLEKIWNSLLSTKIYKYKLEIYKKSLVFQN